MAPNAIFPVGDDALGITQTDKAMRDRLALALRADQNWLEIIPGATGLTVQFDPTTETPGEAAARLATALSQPVATGIVTQTKLEIPVCYEPPYALDMDEICAALNLTPAELVARHTAPLYRIDLLGFTPGFAYLEEGDPNLNVPRKAIPRQRLPAGSVGLAGGLTGLYALAGPGGWPIIGRTPLALFGNQYTDMFNLDAGMLIRFRAISAAEFKALS